MRFRELISTVLLGFSSVGQAASAPCPPQGTQAPSLHHKSAAAAQPALQMVCADRKKFLQDAYAKKVSHASILKEASASKSPVIMIGESHTERSKQFYKWALKKLVDDDPKVDCVLVEQPEEEYRAILDACNRNQNCNRAKLPAFSGVKEAYELGLKVMAVDAVPKVQAVPSFGGGGSAVSPKEFLDDVENRNRHMAGATSKLLKKECQRAVLIIGALHGHKDPRLKSIPELLDAEGIASHRIALASPATDRYGNLDRSWNMLGADGKSLCKQIPGNIVRNFGFSTAGSKGGTAAYYGPFSDPYSDKMEMIGRWNDYHSVIAIGCENPDQESCQSSSDSYPLKNKAYLK